MHFLTSTGNPGALFTETLPPYFWNFAILPGDFNGDGVTDLLARGG